MANGAALIREALWRDQDFRALPRTAQCLYLQLLSQKDLDCAGVLTLNRDVLVKGCSEMTLADLNYDLKMLCQTRFTVVDSDSDEVLIRSYVRLVSVLSPNAWKAAKVHALRVHSQEIRLMLASELRRLGRPDATDLATTITAGCTPSESHPDPIPTPSERGIPFEPHSEPLVPVPVPVPRSPSVGGWVGRAPDGAAPCPKHPNGPKHDEPCRACQLIREDAEAQREAELLAEAERRATRREAINACALCDHNGMRELANDLLARCTHTTDRDDDEEPF